MCLVIKIGLASQKPKNKFLNYGAPWHAWDDLAPLQAANGSWKALGPVVQRNFVTILALNYLGAKSTGLN
jgi:hypothetical protein